VTSRRPATQTAATARAAKTTSLIRTMTTGAVSKAFGVVKACQAYAKRTPAAGEKDTGSRCLIIRNAQLLCCCDHLSTSTSG
jgi:hypothetical protein